MTSSKNEPWVNPQIPACHHFPVFKNWYTQSKNKLHLFCQFICLPYHKNDSILITNIIFLIIPSMLEYHVFMMQPQGLFQDSNLLEDSLLVGTCLKVVSWLAAFFDARNHQIHITWFSPQCLSCGENHTPWDMFSEHTINLTRVNVVYGVAKVWRWHCLACIYKRFIAKKYQKHQNRHHGFILRESGPINPL